MSTASRLLPLGCAILAGLWVTLNMTGRQEDALRLYEFGKTPVQDGGRIKPIDTVARVSLLAVSGKQSWSDADGKRQPAIKWFLDVQSGGVFGPALQHQVFHIANPDLLTELGLQRRPGLRYALAEFQPDPHVVRIENEKLLRLLGLEPRPGHRYSLADLGPSLRTLVREMQRVAAERAKPGDYENALDELWEHTRPYLALDFRIESAEMLKLLQLEPRPEHRYLLAEFASKLEALREEADRVARLPKQELTAYGKNVINLWTQINVHLAIGELGREAERAAGVTDNERSAYEKSVVELAEHVKLYSELATHKTPQIVPSPLATPKNDRWLTFAEVEELTHPDKDQEGQLAALLKGKDLKTIREKLQVADSSWQRILDSYQASKGAAFDKALGDFQACLADVPASTLKKVGFEAFFNDFSPFSVVFPLYIAAFVLVCLSWLFGALCGVQWHRPLVWSGSAVMLMALLVHAFGLFGRMYLSDRWLVFVTNLYSSAVFIAFGAVIAGLILEAIFGYGIGAAVGSVLGFTIIYVGGTLVKGEDTLEMMRAVLDTNFWLATHVTCVTLGYTATFVAGGLGIGYIGTGLFSPALRDRDLLKILSQAIYGVVCFAMLFSFTGTVLGGVWADQSWGRFWGWDPKENGALLIVLWNALILHARWCGMVKQRGVAVLTVVGNMITAWSWFGTNQLGIGLHAYGFDSGLSLGLTTFWVSQLAVIAMGLVPLKYWQSFAPRRA